MERLSPLSIQQKLIAVVLVTTMVALIVALGAIVAYDLRVYHRSLIADMTTQAELLGRMTAPALTFDDRKVADENLGLLRFRPQVGAAAIYNARGVLFASYARQGNIQEFPKLPEPDGMRIDGHDLILFKRTVSDGEILGTVYLRADYELFDRVRDYFGIALLVAVIAMFVAFLMSSRLQKYVTRPVLAIAGIAREVVAQRNYSRRAEKMSNDEVGELVEAFNDMLAEIERRTVEIEASNNRLALEVDERSRSEQEIARLNRELESRVSERTAQLEAANKELEAFSYSVSHDLRAPLRAIDGFSQALIEDLPDDLSEEGHRYLSRIRSSVQRMGQLIEDLLNLSRVSRSALEQRTTDLSELSRQVLADLQQRDPDRHVEVTIWDGMSVEADSRLLRAALENLIGNAWKFTSKTEKAHIEVGSLRTGEEVTFFVRDNGTGFDMAYADKLFGAFQRLHAMSEFPGTGIGLATVQRIVTRHGGRIWADAQPGKGAAFFFTLGPGRPESAGPVQT
jgi:signal transduction histidine kinase